MATSVPGLLCQSGRRRPENVSIDLKYPTIKTTAAPHTSDPSSLKARGRDSCLRAVLCYKRIFRSLKACMGCKRFFLKEKKHVMFLNKIDLFYCLVVFFVVSLRLRPF